MSKRRSIFKISMVGDGAVGKTSIRQRWIGQTFKQSYMMTIGADFETKMVDIQGEEVVMQIWDTAGQQRFQSVRSVFYKGATALILVFDLTRTATYESIPNWIEEAMKHSGITPVIVLVGNKADLVDLREIRESQVREYVHELSQWLGDIVPYIETSALTGENVDHLFETLGESLLKKYSHTTDTKKSEEREQTTLSPILLEDDEELLYERGFA